MASSRPPARFLLTIVQQPLRARVIVPGDRDRRPIDPCPVVQVKEIQSDGSVVEIDYLDEKYVMSAQLLDETGKTLIDTVPVVVDGSQQDAASSAAYETAPGQPIFGARESSVYPIKDLDDKQKVFYCFPDMRVRNLGRFRLRFMLFYLPDEDSPFPRANTILATVTSDVFMVYNARDFPGIGKTTALSKKLSSQGVPIPNRNKDRLKYNDGDSTDG